MDRGNQDRDSRHLRSASVERRLHDASGESEGMSDPVDYAKEGKRWENTAHHPMAVKLMAWMMDIDLHAYNDSLYLKAGGDGDEGEHLMFLMDGFFERGLHREPERP